MAGLDHVYLLKDHQLWGDAKRVLNCWTYACDYNGAGMPLSDLLSLWAVTTLQHVLSTQSSAVTHDQLELFDMTDGVDYASMTLTVDNVGQRSGEARAPFEAWAFRLNRETRATRHGQKRLAGVAEGDAADYEPTTAMLAILATAATNFEDGLYQPVMGARVRMCRNVIVSKPPTGAWTLDDVNGVSSVQFVRLTSQVSRRIYL